MTTISSAAWQGPSRVEMKASAGRVPRRRARAGKVLLWEEERRLPDRARSRAGNDDGGERLGRGAQSDQAGSDAGVRVTYMGAGASPSSSTGRVPLEGAVHM